MSAVPPAHGSFAGGELSRELRLGLGCAWPLAATLQHPPLAWAWPTPVLKREIKLCQLTQLPQVFLPLPQSSFLFFFFFVMSSDSFWFLWFTNGFPYQQIYSSD